MAAKKKTPSPPNSSQPCDDGKVHPALKGYFGYCFFKAAVRLRMAILEEVENHGIEMAPQLGILVILRSSEPVNQATLGEQIGVDKATMVRLIDGLEKRKYVERVADTKDRRNKLVRITPKGRQLSLSAQERVREVEKAFLARLEPREREAVLSAIPKLLNEND